MNGGRGLWHLERTPEAKARRKRNAHIRERNRLIREMPPEERKRRQQRLLSFKLRSIFNHKEYITYESLPESLGVKPFEGELLYPLEFPIG